MPKPLQPKRRNSSQYSLLEVNKKEIPDSAAAQRFLKEVAEEFECCFVIYPAEFGGKGLLLQVHVPRFHEANRAARNKFETRVGPAPRATSDCVYLDAPGRSLFVARSGSDRYPAKLGALIGGDKITSNFESAKRLLSGP